MSVPDGFRVYRGWFYAAAVYNLLWGAFMMAFPNRFFDWIGMTPPHPSIWQCVGMMVLAYAPGYWLLARDPRRYAAFVWIGLLGKTLGPLGFLMAASQGQLPWAFGLTLLTNDVVWWPVFWSFALKHARWKDL